ncbi:MAG TPA: energy transducer TonB [Burkholderiaceae bacterium]|jgi:hypothetical protein|nr:energy transducer TonB [Burkholderiaceae bacterium]
MRIVTLGVALIILGSAGQASAGDSAEPVQYVIKQSEPSTGSNIKRPIIKAGTISINKRYADLTPAEKAILRSEFAQMKESDEPPFPAKGLMPVLNELRKVHEQTGLENKGAVAVNVQVDSQGNPTSVSIIDSPSPDISQVASVALMAQTYKPALCGGTSCAMEYHFRAELIGSSDDRLSNSGAQTSRVNTSGK